MQIHTLSQCQCFGAGCKILHSHICCNASPTIEDDACCHVQFVVHHFQGPLQMKEMQNRKGSPTQLRGAASPAAHQRGNRGDNNAGADGAPHTTLLPTLQASSPSQDNSNSQTAIYWWYISAHGAGAEGCGGEALWVSMDLFLEPAVHCPLLSACHKLSPKN